MLTLIVVVALDENDFDVELIADVVVNSRLRSQALPESQGSHDRPAGDWNGYSVEYRDQYPSTTQVCV